MERQAICSVNDRSFLAMLEAFPQFLLFKAGWNPPEPININDISRAASFNCQDGMIRNKSPTPLKLICNYFETKKKRRPELRSG